MAFANCLQLERKQARTVVVDAKTIAAIKTYQDERGADNSDIIFPPGDGRDPANKWTQMLAKFFKKHKLNVKSHDFRVTQATEFYKATQDIVKTQNFIGHSKVETTLRYVKLARKELDKTTYEFLNKQKQEKRKRIDVLNN